MMESLLKRIENNRKAHSRWVALVLCLSMLVSLGTFAGFRQKAVAKTYTKEVLDCPYTHEGAEPVAHVHNDDCYDGEALVCALPEIEAHTHTEACFAEQRTLTCTLAENPGHQHGEGCYAAREENVCGLEENPGHVHNGTCFNDSGVLICTMAEGDGAHTHTADCFTTVYDLVCEIPEGEGAHTHTDECYSTERVMICDKQELPVHVHDAGCIRTEEITVDEPEETAEPEEKTIPEMPVSDPNADLETASDWEQDFEDLELSGNWARDLVLVAATQQGRGESPNNFEAILNDAGDAWVTHGYTRYGAWYGVTYAEEWSAMFVSFCLRYAGIPEENVPNNPTAAFMAESFQKGELFAGRDYVPAVGDLIFFDTVDDEITNIDHMGIVYHVDAEDGTINTVEGDRTNAVATFGYHLDDEQIVGYGILPQNPDYIPTEEENNNDELDNLIVTTEQITETTVPAVPMPAQSWERTAGGIKVSVDAPEGAFPENTKIAVTPVNGNSLKDTVSDAVSGEVLEVQAVDITFFDAEGHEIEPAVPIRVSMTPAATEHAEEKTNVVHVDVAQQTAELIEQAVGTEFDNSEVVFDADTFTIYAIVYTYQVEYEYEVDGKTFTSSMPGAENMTLTQIVEGLGIVDEAEIDTFVSKIQSIASTNEEVAIVTENSEIRVLKDGEAKIVITMQDGAKFHIDVRAEGETSASNETATVSTKGDLYLPADAELKAEVLDEVKSESAIAAVEAKEGTANSNAAAAETAYQVFDISLENVEADQYDGFQVEVKLPEGVVGKNFHLYHVHGGKVDELELDNVDPDGETVLLESVSFVTPSFSEFVLSYTVDFTYDGSIYSMAGKGSVLLSDLISFLSINIDISNVTDVTFSNPALLDVEKEGSDWLLTSLESFATVETLAISLNNGQVISVKVTDPPGPTHESSDLKDFITKVTVTGAQLQGNSYVVEQGQTYGVTMSFKETANLQFDNDATLIYHLPNGVTLPDNVTKPIKINVVSNKVTYEVSATVTASTDGTVSVVFDQSDPNYSKLAHSTNIGFNVRLDARFDENISKTAWGGRIDRDIILDTTDHSDAFAEKTGEFDETTGMFNYTINVTAQGNPHNVNVKDLISGNALIFNHDVRVSGNSASYHTNSLQNGENGFDYTFSSMQDGEVITITYSASLDPNIAKNADTVTADMTKNTVTVQKEDGTPHHAEYSHEINMKKPDKSDGSESGVTPDGDKVYSWTIEYNPLALVSAAGDTVVDTIGAGSQEYMKYYGDVTVKVYNHSGGLVATRSFTPGSDSSWSYIVPAEDTTPYRYVFEYETVVDQDKVNGLGHGLQLTNESVGKGGSDGGKIDIGPTEDTTITKEVESSNTQEITWVSRIHVPEGGLTTAVVTDTLPNIYFDGANHFDDLQGTVQILGLLEGETYDTPTVETGADAKKKVVINFKYNGSNGLKGVTGGHDITIRLTTSVNQEWLLHGYEVGDIDELRYFMDHKNEININGTVKDDATKTFSKPDLKKSGQIENGLYLYTLILSGVTEEPINIEDTFDTNLLEVATPQDYRHFTLWGGDQYSQGLGATAVNYSDTENGIMITANTVPKQANGEYYSHYKIQYFLKLKDGVDLEALAIENGGKFDLTNKAIWGTHESEYKFTTKYDFLDKQILQEASSTNRNVKYRITYNLAKAELNGGNDVEMVDKLSSTLSVDYTTIKITTDPAGVNVPYELGGDDEGNTIAKYTIPDSTAVTIEYDAMVVGNGSVKYENTVEANGELEKVERTSNINIEGEGEGAVADLRISKVDGYDASKKLAGVKFKLYSENKDKDLSLDGSGLYEKILETDQNGVLHIDGDKINIVMDADGTVKYYIEEVDAPEGYAKLKMPYQFRLTDNIENVKYTDYIYFYSDSFQIKNWPLEGLILEKQVESNHQEDLSKVYKFIIELSDEDVPEATYSDAIVHGNEVNGKYGDVTFTNGRAEVELFHNQQVSINGLPVPAGTKYRIEELEESAAGFNVSINVTASETAGASESGESSEAGSVSEGEHTTGSESAETTTTGRIYNGVISHDDYTKVVYTNAKEQIAVTVEKRWEPMPEDSDASVTVELHRYAKITQGIINLTLTDQNGDPIPGATFQLYKDGSAQEGTYTTNANGKISISGLDRGSYYLKQTAAPDGYSMGDTAPQTETLTVTDVTTVQKLDSNLSNTKLKTTGSVTINLTSAVDHSAISGAGFSLYKDGSLVASGTTDANGQVTFDNLSAGSYTVKQTSTNSDLKIAADQNFTITGTEDKELTFTNVKKPVLYTLRFESSSDNLSAEYKFEKDTEVTITFDNGNQFYNPYYGISLSGDVSGEVSEGNVSFSITMNGNKVVTLSETSNSNWGNTAGAIQLSPDPYTEDTTNTTSTTRSTKSLRMSAPLKAASDTVTHTDATPASAPTGYAEDSEFEPISYTLTGDEWSYTFPEQDKKDANGNLYYYYVVETAHTPNDYWIDSYSGDPLSESGTITITNKKEDEKGKLIVDKTWAGVTDESDLAALQTGFTVTVTGIDAGGSGVNTKTFSYSELPATIENLPLDATYNITESNSATETLAKYNVVSASTTDHFDAATPSVSGETYTLVNTYEPAKGALKLTKAVKVNESDPTPENQALTNGIYEFTIHSVADADNTSNDITVKIKFADGKATKYQIGTENEVSVSEEQATNNTWSVVVPNLTPGEYTITEKTPDNGMALLTAVRGTGEGEGDAAAVNENKVVKVTVLPGDTTPESTTAQATFANNVNTGELKITKKVTVEGQTTNADFADGEYFFTLTKSGVTDPEDPAYYARGTVNGTAIENGKVGITITNGTAKSVEIKDIPVGKYVITEDTPNNGTTLTSIEGGSDPKTDTSVTVEIAAASESGSGESQAVVVTFTNNKNPSALEDYQDVHLEKKWYQSDGTTELSSEETADKTIKYRIRQLRAEIKDSKAIYPVVIRLLNADGTEVMSKTYYVASLAKPNIQVQKNNNDSSYKVDVLASWLGGNYSRSAILSPDNNNPARYNYTSPGIVSEMLITIKSQNTNNKLNDVTLTSAYKADNPKDYIDQLDQNSFTFTELSSAEVELKAGTEAVTFELNDITYSANHSNWAATLNHLPFYNRAGGSFYVYRYEIDEVEVNGEPVTVNEDQTSESASYVVTYSTAADGTVTIKNTEKPTVEVSATKEWQDATGTKMSTPPENATITFELYVDGNPTGKTVELNGKADVSALSEDQAVAAGQELKAEAVSSGNYEVESWKAIWKNLPRFKEDGTTQIVYTVKEVGKFAGYEPVSDIIEADGTIINKQALIDIDILKTDNADKALTGASFELVQYTSAEFQGKTDNGYDQTKSVNENGMLTFDGVSTGYFKLSETVTPAGYVKTSTDPTFRVYLENGELKVEILNNAGNTVSYKKATVETTERHQITVVNIPGTVLPQTGGIGTALFTALGGLMTAMAGAILTMKSYRRRKENA